MEKKRMRIEHLPKEKWKGTILPIGYTAEEYYGVTVDRSQKGFSVELVRKAFDGPVAHTPEEYDFPDRPYADWWEKACAWGSVEQLTGCSLRLRSNTFRHSGRRDEAGENRRFA